jgi:hypothetical protein
MAVIKTSRMDKYKMYYTENVKGKDGITRPITKCGYVKPCPQCGGDMLLDNCKPGGVHKRSIIRWKCQDVKYCKHGEQEEGGTEMVRRMAQDR